MMTQESQKLKCEVCGIVFSNIEQFVKHFNENHSEITELEYDDMKMNCETPWWRKGQTLVIWSLEWEP